MPSRVLLSWSSGKDCAWTLHQLRQQPQFEVVGLLTTFNAAFNRVAMHGVRMELVEAQAVAAGLPLWAIPLPWPCSNEIYEARLQLVWSQARDARVEYVAFGDLFLADVRAYRERQLSGTGLQPLFPLWGTLQETSSLADKMIAAGLRAQLTCVDPQQLDPQFVGREFDTRLLAELPTSADPCGERGEFHTFCYDGPIYDRRIAFTQGEVVNRDGFWFIDLLPG